MKSAVLNSVMRRTTSPSTRREWIEIVVTDFRDWLRLSPSTRREWIEIAMSGKMHISYCVSLHTEGVD